MSQPASAGFFISGGEMLNKEQAAKYLVVAWVKDWPMRALLETLDGATGEVSDARIGRLVSALPFMPVHKHWYIASKGAGVSTRHFVADAYPRLNEALWDAKDNAARLKLAAQIGRLKAGSVTASSRFSVAEEAERRAVDRAARQATTSYRASRDAFKTHQRSAWNVCK